MRDGLNYTTLELLARGTEETAESCRNAFSRISQSAFAAAQVGPTPGMARNRVGPFGNTS